MRYFFTVFICKIFIFVLKITGHKGTSAPGKLAFKLYPDILTVFGTKVKKEIIAVMGTNGKTTTNNLLADFLEKEGYEVACNRVGANMDEGSVVAFIDKCNLFGGIKVDYACLEMDEGWAEYILKYITPSKIIITNLFRDQLDRYGEIDITMNFLKKAIALAPNATLILNADDPLTVATAYEFKNKKIYYGIKNPFREYETKIREGRFCYLCGKKLNYNFYHFSQVGDYYCECGFKRPDIDFNADKINVFPKISFNVDNYGEISFSGRGMYNIYNVLASVCCANMCGVSKKTVDICTKAYKPQTGRMEEYKINKKSVFLVLAKNPAGFNQSVGSVTEDPRTKDIIIAINDGIQDGTDVSWLWDVDFEGLMKSNVTSYHTAGVRYADMAVRLKYAGVPEKEITCHSEILHAVESLLTSGGGQAVYVLVNYTALFKTQDILKELKEKYGD